MLLEWQIKTLDKIKNGLYTQKTIGNQQVVAWVKELISEKKVTLSMHRNYLEITDINYNKLIGNFKPKEIKPTKPKKYKKVEITNEFLERVDKFKRDNKYNNTQLFKALGMSEKLLYDWRKEGTQSRYSTFTRINNNLKELGY